MSPESLERVLRDLFAGQSLAVLSTHGEGQPYGNLVAFAATGDLRHLLFATNRATRKFANLRGNPQVSLLVDNRANREDDFQRAVAVTATGAARDTAGAERDELLRVYRARHPALEDFVSDPDCALVAVRVEAYVVVRRFREVAVLRPDGSAP